MKMDVKHINPFLLSIKEISNQVLNCEPKFDKPFVRNTPLNLKGVLIIIGITGEKLNRKVLVNLDKKSCTNIASGMMGGTPIDFGEMSKSAVGELCNMILGRTSTIFENDGININITSPTILESNDLKTSLKEQVICIPINIKEQIKMMFNITTEEK